MLVIVLAGCGGDGGGGPAAPAPGVPVISNLNATFLAQGQRCDGGSGTVLSISVNYKDSDGDIRGGTLQTTGRCEPSGFSDDENFALPSEATVTGETEGTVEALVCVVGFGSDTAITISVALVDKAGHSSNVLSKRVNRPAGAPEVPQGGGAGEGGMKRLRR